jgi:hypothetical protein
MLNPSIRKAFNSLGLGCILGSILTVGQHMRRDKHLSPRLHSLSYSLWEGRYFDGVAAYKVEVAALLLGLAVVAFPFGLRWLRRFFRAWWVGGARPRLGNRFLRRSEAFGNKRSPALVGGGDGPCIGRHICGEAELAPIAVTLCGRKTRALPESDAFRLTGHITGAGTLHGQMR